jgi:undecaprenyl diphosphate synthase
MTDAEWSERIDRLAAISGAAGAGWLTLRPFERGAGSDAARPVHHGVVEQPGCTVIVDPHPDGHERLVVALRKLAEIDQLREEAVVPALLAPADVEPDLVLLLGPADRLPTSLVWELAYSELVYVDVPWAALGADHLRAAVHTYHGRHRRFGGLD